MAETAKPITSQISVPEAEMGRYRKLVKVLDESFQGAKTARSGIESDMSLINKYIRPNTPMVGSAVSSQSLANRQKQDRIYDPIGQECNFDFAANMQAYITSPTEKFFSVAPFGVDMNGASPMQRQARAKIETIMHKFFCLPHSNFNSAMHEMYLDGGGYGNALPFGSWSKKWKCNVYNVEPFTNVYFAEDAEGFVDTTFIEKRYTADQLRGLSELLKGGLICLPQLVLNAKGTDVFTVRKVILPREKYATIDKSGLSLPSSKPIAYVYWMPDHNCIIYEGGFDENPFFPFRLIKYAGDTYGLALGQIAMALVLNANTVMRDYMMSGSLNLRHPWWIEDDSIVGPFDGNLVPGLILKGQPNSKKPEPLAPAGQLEYGESFLQNLYARIRKIFFLDDFIREKKKERQSLGEVVDERDEMLKGLSPVFGRGAGECLTRLVRWHFISLVDNGVISKELVATSGINKDTIQVELVGPAAKAFKSRQTANIQKYLQDMAQLAPIVPDIFDGVSTAKLGRLYAGNRDVEDIILESDDAIKKKQQARAEAQAANAQAAQAESVSQSMKNLADAGAKGLGNF